MPKTLDAKTQSSQWLLRSFLQYPRRIGAIAPASQALITEMLRYVPFAHARVIVEWGPGTGAITASILARKRPETLYLGLDLHEPFIQHLRETYQNVPNTLFLQADFQETPAILHRFHQPRADALISSLPISILPEPEKVFQVAALSTRGLFVQYMYTLALVKGCWPPRWIRRYFGHHQVRLVLRNLPPTLVFHCFLTPETLGVLEGERVLATGLPVIGV